MSAKKIARMSAVPISIEPLIREVRGIRVIADDDVARVYGVPTFRLNEAVKRNARRFPEDFVFQLTSDEWRTISASATGQRHEKDPHHLISQNAISSAQHGGRRKRPHVFTEHGALMAANILRSPRAQDMSVFVVRAFVQMRQALGSRKEIEERLRELEGRMSRHDVHIREIIETLKRLLALPQPTRRPIGFRVEEAAAPSKTRSRRRA